MIWIIIFIYLFVSSVNAVSSIFKSDTQNPIIKTKLGWIKGEIYNTWLGTEYSSFRGIPYAKAPIGNLRFRQAVPLTNWSYILDATNDSKVCPQDRVISYSEDCLYLNVYTKNIINNVVSKTSSVIFYIYGGSLVSGSNVKDNVGPDYLLEQNIVLVVANYRLGPLGFLSTGTKDCPGNAGFKDQVVALRWVRDNIADFGGDKNSVTLVGHSAGARSVSLHILSPMSMGLFHRAIMLSGSTTTQWKVENNQLESAIKISDYIGCPTETTEIMLSCLKSVSVSSLVDSLSVLKLFGNHPILTYFPIVEKDFGQERFLTDNPTTLLATGSFNRVPIIAGITKDEWITSVPYFLNNQSITKELNDNFLKWAPVIFMYEKNSIRSIEISNRLRNEFLNQTLIDNSFESLGALISDAATRFGVHRFVHLAAKYTKVYYYKITYVGRFSFFYYPTNNPYGIVHGDELQYILGLKTLSPMIYNEADPESLTVKRMTALFSNFAHTGNPNDPDNELLQNITWENFNFYKENYLNIGDELLMENKLSIDRFNIWDELFPIITSYGWKNEAYLILIFIFTFISLNMNLFA